MKGACIFVLLLVGIASSQDKEECDTMVHSCITGLDLKNGCRSMRGAVRCLERVTRKCAKTADEMAVLLSLMLDVDEAAEILCGMESGQKCAQEFDVAASIEMCIGNVVALEDEVEEEEIKEGLEVSEADALCLLAHYVVECAGDAIANACGRIVAEPYKKGMATGVAQTLAQIGGAENSELCKEFEEEDSMKNRFASPVPFNRERRDNEKKRAALVYKRFVSKRGKRSGNVSRLRRELARRALEKEIL